MHHPTVLLSVFITALLMGRRTSLSAIATGVVIVLSSGPVCRAIGKG